MVERSPDKVSKVGDSLVGQITTATNPATRAYVAGAHSPRSVKHQRAALPLRRNQCGSTSERPRLFRRRRSVSLQGGDETV